MKPKIARPRLSLLCRRAPMVSLESWGPPGETNSHEPIESGGPTRRHFLTLDRFFDQHNVVRPS